MASGEGLAAWRSSCQQTLGSWECARVSGQKYFGAVLSPHRVPLHLVQPLDACWLDMAVSALQSLGIPNLHGCSEATKSFT